MTITTLTDGQQQLPNVLHTDAAELARSLFGVSAGKDGLFAKPEVYLNDRIIQNFRGAGVITDHDGRVTNIASRSNYVGFKFGKSDSLLSTSTIYNNRDANIWVSRDAGNCQVYGTHAYGSRIGVYNEGGGKFQYVGGMIADSLAGTVCNDNSRFNGVSFQHNSVADAIFRGGYCSLLDCELYVQAETVERNELRIPGLFGYSGKCGVRIEGGGAVIDGGIFRMLDWKHDLHTRSGRPAAAIVVAADDVDIRTRIEDVDGIPGTVAIRIERPVKGLNVDCRLIAFEKDGVPLEVMPGAEGWEGSIRFNGVEARQ